MKKNKIKILKTKANYSIIIGNNTLNLLKKKIKLICPKTRKIVLVTDKNIPKKFKIKIKKILNNYELISYEFSPNEKLKSFKKVNYLVEECNQKNLNRSDLIIAFGGGIIGDYASFVASIIKRGVNFINIPTTLLAQVDSSVGGKTGVNSKFGKNLIGSFYQPKLVISDVSLLKSLPSREMICGYAEILKHSLIHSRKFFNFLKLKSNQIIFERNLNLIALAISESCKIKLFFVNKDAKEKNVRMILNFGHTFAHAIELKNNYSKSINHGEAVLAGIIIATKISYFKKIINRKDFFEILNIFENVGLDVIVKRILEKINIKSIINYMKSDKKNNDKKINLILIKRVGKTTLPGKTKMSTNELKRLIGKII